MQGERAVTWWSHEEIAFDDLFTAYFDRVYTYMRVSLRNTHDAEDGTQQVFLQVLRSLPRYDPARREPFERWLFTIARNEVITILRRRRPELAEPASLVLVRETRTEPVPRGAFDWIDDARLLGSVERLPVAQRQVIVLRYALGFNTADTAAVLGRGPHAVRQLHHRALRTLERRLLATRAA